MVSTYSPNINLEEPARGDQVGTWDTPVNANMTLIDLILGGLTTISLNNSPVTLSAAQFQCKTITLNSTLTGSVQITFPTSFKKSYEIYNTCTGTSAFVVQLLTTAAGGQIISCPPGEIVDVINDGTNIRFKNLGRIGDYRDYGGSSLPNWVQNCTVQPYLLCDGTTFSSATYPFLTNILGGTTLPDSKGRFRATLNQGSARIVSSLTNVDGNTLFAAGGDQNLSAHSHVMTVTDPGHNHTTNANTGATTTGGGGFPAGGNGAASNAAAVTGITVSAANAGIGTAQNIPPVYIGGITMIRSA